MSILRRKISNVRAISNNGGRLERAEASTCGLLILSRLHKSRRTNGVHFPPLSPPPPVSIAFAPQLAINLSVGQKWLGPPLCKSARIREEGFWSASKGRVIEMWWWGVYLVPPPATGSDCEDYLKERQGRRPITGSHWKWLHILLT